ncbi:MAG: amidohydrolase family protein [Bacteroidales bacterium]
MHSIKRYAANYILPVNSLPVHNGIIEIQGLQVVKIIKPEPVFREIENTRFYNGILIPGFILPGALPRGTKFNFVKDWKELESLLGGKEINEMDICLQNLSSGENTEETFSRVKEITLKLPHLDFSEILRWVTINPSIALGIDKNTGSLDVGKTPGILWIGNFDFERFTLRENSFIKELVSRGYS